MVLVGRIRQSTSTTYHISRAPVIALSQLILHCILLKKTISAAFSPLKRLGFSVIVFPHAWNGRSDAADNVYTSRYVCGNLATRSEKCLVLLFPGGRNGRRFAYGLNRLALVAIKGHFIRDGCPSPIEQTMAYGRGEVLRLHASLPHTVWHELFCLWILEDVVIGPLLIINIINMWGSLCPSPVASIKLFINSVAGSPW